MEYSEPAVLFDLDGTLVDPAGGITGGIAYALRAVGVPVPPAEALNSMVGPKLSDSLAEHTSASPEQIPAIIGLYRTWYRERGIALGRPYPGLPDLLAVLRARNVRLAVATQKPQTLAHTVLAAHGLLQFFPVVCGSSDDETLVPGDPGYRRGKASIIAAALAGLQTDSGVMVGDRSHDVQGAAANGIPCVGVGWGFAAPGELEAAGAAAVVGTSGDLAAALDSYLASASALDPSSAGRGTL